MRLKILTPGALKSRINFRPLESGFQPARVASILNCVNFRPGKINRVSIFLFGFPNIRPKGTVTLSAVGTLRQLVGANKKMNGTCYMFEFE